VIYAIFGTSRTLAVGPVAVVSLMTAAAAGAIASQCTPEYLGAAMALALISGLLLLGMGLVVGVALSVFLHLYRTSKPHVAIVGQVPGTEHFRNVTRHSVATDPGIMSLRVDESLYFPNARFLEDRINQAVAADPAIRHVILVCPAVNMIDASALESLEAINHRLKDGGIAFHLSEVKGPVMERLKRTHSLQELTGMVHLTQYDAVSSINPDLARRTLDARRQEVPVG
jgi:SulP family sulfate permease